MYFNALTNNHKDGAACCLPLFISQIELQVYAECRTVSCGASGLRSSRGSGPHPPGELDSVVARLVCAAAPDRCRNRRTEYHNQKCYRGLAQIWCRSAYECDCCANLVIRKRIWHRCKCCLGYVCSTFAVFDLGSFDLLL